jgi:hypothetical protein
VRLGDPDCFELLDSPVSALGNPLGKKNAQYSVLSLEKLLLCCLAVILPSSHVDLDTRCLTWQINAHHTNGGIFASLSWCSTTLDSLYNLHLLSSENSSHAMRQHESDWQGCNEEQLSSNWSKRLNVCTTCTRRKCIFWPDNIRKFLEVRANFGAQIKYSFVQAPRTRKSSRFPRSN